MLTQLPSWPYLPTLARLALALAIGLFIGIERERRHKEAGLRTFAFAALLGAVGGLLGESYSLLVLALVGVLIVFLNVETIRTNEGAEITTSAALLVTTFAGLLAGQGHTFTPTALGVVTAALLAWKQPLAGFSHGLTESELRSAILLAILAFVAYPIIPTGSIDPWGLVQPRTVWTTVLLIAGLGFTNYVLLKLYGARGIELAGFLGGLVNSTVTVTELMRRAQVYGSGLVDATYRGIVFATAAMLVRNAVILGLLAPTVLLASSIPFALMLIAALLAGEIHPRVNRDEHPASDTERPMHLEVSPVSFLSTLESPFSLSAAFKFAIIFLAIEIAGTLAQRALGQFGFYAVSLIGGAVSSASAVASAASLAQAGTLPAHVAGTGAVLASTVSALINLPVVARLGNDRVLTTRIAWALGIIVILGAVGSAMQTF
jgi:uncharacterized membrane protein (DUF4010 family)